MSEAISITGLEESFGRTRALDGLDLEVAQGQVHGYLGPDGAGKTTTIRILLAPAWGEYALTRVFVGGGERI